MERYPKLMDTLARAEDRAKKSPKDQALAKGKYWLPDVVDCKPTYTWDDDKKPNRPSKFAQDFEEDE